MSERIGYYAKQEAVTEKLYACLRDIKRRIQAGQKLGTRGRHANTQEGGNICLRDVIPSYGLSTSWSPFVKGFDYSQPISPERVAVERHRWQTEEEIRWALRHPEAAAIRVGEKAEELPAPKPRTEKKTREGEPRQKPYRELAPVAVPDIRLHDWHFTDYMKGLVCVWTIKDGRSTQTTHSLEPQVYAEEIRTNKNGQEYVVRRYIGGSFHDGKLTGREQKRIVREARQTLAATFPELTLEQAGESETKFKYLMR